MSRPYSSSVTVHILQGCGVGDGPRRRVTTSSVTKSRDEITMVKTLRRFVCMQKEIVEETES